MSVSTRIFHESLIRNFTLYFEASQQVYYSRSCPSVALFLIDLAASLDLLDVRYITSLTPILIALLIMYVVMMKSLPTCSSNPKWLR